METKKCGKCKNDFPKTEEFFFKRIIKQSNKNGISTYYSFKSNCKKCFGKQASDRRVLKRCVDLNCNVLEYKQKWKEQYTNTRSIYKLQNNETLVMFHSRNITDIYIKMLLRNSFLPKEIIETKRLIIELKRQLKTIKN